MPRERKINKGKIAAGVIIGEEFFLAILTGEDTRIKILADPEQPIKAGAVKNIVEAFTLGVLKRRIILGTSLGILVAKNLINPAEIQQLIPVWLSEIENIEELIRMDKKTEKRMDKNPMALEYYAVGMGVMYILFATNAGAETIFQERRNKTLERIKVVPISEREILGGKLFGIFLIALLQFMMIVFFTRIFYRVNWGGSLLGIIIMILSSVLAFSGLSIFFASLTKSEEQIGNIGPALAMIFGFMGGGMVQERHNKTLARLLTTPTEKFFLISGKMLGFFLIGFIQFMILILFGQLVLKVNWGNLPLGVLLLMISYVLSVTGLGTLLSVIVRTSAQAGVFAVLISMVTSMLGGAW